MMNRKIAVMLLALPLGTLPIGAIASLAQSATAAEITSPAGVRQAPVVLAQRFDNDQRDRNQNNDQRDRNQNNDRREAAQREAAQREAARRNAPRRVWVPGHWESGFLGIGRKWVEGHWENR